MNPENGGRKELSGPTNPLNLVQSTEIPYSPFPAALYRNDQGMKSERERKKKEEKKTGKKPEKREGGSFPWGDRVCSNGALCALLSCDAKEKLFGKYRYAANNVRTARLRLSRAYGRSGASRSSTIADGGIPLCHDASKLIPEQ